MNRAYYENTLQFFLEEDSNAILGKLTAANQFSLEELQRNAWQEQIEILKCELKGFQDGHIIFEYTIPRMGRRIDTVFILNGVVYLFEFKIGEKEYPHSAINQITDYALDLKNFHKESHNITLVPILICSNAPNKENIFTELKSGIQNIIFCNKNNIQTNINCISKRIPSTELCAQSWLKSQYAPTPTIIEAAQILYKTHSVVDISRNDASAHNLSKTKDAVDKIIEKTVLANEKTICFITGVPGAGKTLAGLNIAIDRQSVDAKQHATFLSGNGPLVDVLQEALARNQVENKKIFKQDALRKTKGFIQNMHHFRDEALNEDMVPVEKIIIFDEAQRAWTSKQLASFMNRKRGMPNFTISEPEFLLSVMDRHQDWAVIICLIGGGQEINTGEAGLTEWINSLREKFTHWNVYLSDTITDAEYSNGIVMDDFLNGIDCKKEKDLHLAVSLRSFRAENMSNFVKALLDINIQSAQCFYKELSEVYPIMITRDINSAKKWVREQAKGTERYGLLASSGAKRLKQYGIWVQSKIDAKQWFLNDSLDVRSSYYLEDAATEFDVQGLELDWAIVSWDADLRKTLKGFQYFNFKGTKWQKRNKIEDQQYLKNAYRVLLTRARQGFIIFIPEGHINDDTCKPEFYDGIYSYLREIGIKEYKEYKED